MCVLDLNFNACSVRGNPRDTWQRRNYVHVPEVTMKESEPLQEQALHSL